VHFLAGSNRHYTSKNAALLRLLDARESADRAIVLLKYCYVDMVLGLSPDVMFSAYCEMASTIQRDHPDVTLVHTTMPLTTVEGALTAAMRRAMSRPTDREASIARHRYNGLLRTEFGENEPLFDLARIEATRLDGTIATFHSAEGSIEILAPENTYDGGHLTSGCQIAAAEALLNVLTDVIETADAIAH